MFVTFPRSGHHALINAVECILGDELKYCEFYTHCHTIGCTGKCNAQKNHDFNLDLTVPNGWTPVIQIRQNERHNLKAWYSLQKRTKQVDERKFLKKKEKFLTDWKERWLNNNYKVVYYEDFLLNIKETAMEIAEIIKPKIRESYPAGSVADRQLNDKLVKLQIYYRHFY